MADPAKTSLAFCGLDPGLRGVLVCIDTDSVVSFWRIPTVAVAEGRRDYDVDAIGRMLFSLPRVGLLLVEKQQPMPDDKRGAIGAWMSGHGYGVLRGLLSAAQIPWEPVAPVVWKRAMEILPPPDRPRRKKGEPKRVETPDQRKARTEARRAAGKALALERARQLYPRVSLRPKGCRVDSPDLAEALLLAHLARSRHQECA